jgi:hypothetical protein
VLRLAAAIHCGKSAGDFKERWQLPAADLRVLSGQFLRHPFCPQEAFGFEDGFMHISQASFAPRFAAESRFLVPGRALT